MLSRKSLDENLFSHKEDRNTNGKGKLEKVKSLKDLCQKVDFEITTFRRSRLFSEFDSPNSNSSKTIIERSIKLFGKEKHDEEFIPFKLEGLQKTKTSRPSVSFKDKQYDPQIVTQLQSIIRTHATKTAMNQYGLSKEKKVAIYDAITEFMDMEKKYTELLQIITESFMNPLSNAKPPIISSEVIKVMFFNTGEIYKYHVSFYNFLSSLLTKKWPAVNISHHLSRHYQKVLDLYEHYADNLSQSEKSILQHLVSKKSFKKFIKQRDSIFELSFTPPSFITLLGYPSKYISHYESVTKKLLFNTQSDTIHFKRLCNAVAMITQFSLFLKESVEQNDNQTIAELLGHKVDLTAVNRRFHRESTVSVNFSSKILLLFNDILLICGKKNRRLKFEKLIPLNELSISEIRRTVDCTLIMFTLRWKKKFFECSEKGKFESSFARDLDLQIKLSKDKIFGIDLKTLLEREKLSLPSLVEKLTLVLDKAPNKVGMFRMVSNQQMIASMRVGEGSEKGNNYNICHRDDVSSLLIAYLRMLPEPIICFNPFDPIYMSGSSPNHALIMEYLNKNIKNMSNHTRNLIEYLAYFVERQISSGFVSLKEMSLHFGPVIIRPLELCSDYCKSMPVVLSIFEFLINKADQLFATDASLRFPNSAVEFLSSDSFGVWWRSFRSKDKNMISFITTDECLDQLLAQILKIDSSLYDNNNNNDDNNNADNNSGSNNALSSTCSIFGVNKEILKLASLATNVLSSDWISIILFEKKDFLEKFFLSFQTCKLEITRKFLCDVILSFLSHFHYSKITQHFISNHDLNLAIISQLSSGNVSALVMRVLQLSNIQHELGDVLLEWASAGLNILSDQIQRDDADISSPLIPNLCSFLVDLLHCEWLTRTHILRESFFEKVTKFFEERKVDVFTKLHYLRFYAEIMIAYITKNMVYVDPNVNTNTWSVDTLRDEPNEKESANSSNLLANLITESEEDSKNINNHDNNNHMDNNNNNSNHMDNNKNNNSNSSSNNNVNELRNSKASLKFQFTALYKSMIATQIVCNDHLTPFLMKFLLFNEITETLKNNDIGLVDKLSLLQLIQAFLSVKENNIYQIIPDSQILSICFEMVKQHPHCSVLHCIIRDIVITILDVQNNELITHMLLHPLFYNMIESSYSETSQFTGHAEIIHNFISNSKFAQNIVQSKNNFAKVWQF